MQEPIRPVVILGGGIGGLATAYQLLKQGIPAILVERNAELGGLMRPVKWGDFQLDVGQKQLYDRIPEVQAFLEEVLEGDLVSYPYRVGAFFKGRVLERDRSHRGIFRGMPLLWIIRGGLDLLWHRFLKGKTTEQHLEAHAYSRKGRFFSRSFTQGFDEKLKCRAWRSVAVPGSSATQEEGSSPIGIWGRIKGWLDRGNSRQKVWWHPRGGTGGLIEALREKILDLGGEIWLNAEVRAIKVHDAKVMGVKIEREDEEVWLWTDHLVSSLRLEILAQLMDLDHHYETKEVSFRRGVILIYAFLDREVDLPHTCLQITDPDLKIGRITNYGAYQCGMVPPGQGCLAFELFCLEDDPWYGASDQDLIDLVRAEFGGMRSFHLDHASSFKVMRLPLGDAAANWSDYLDDPSRARMFQQLLEVSNLYPVGRTGMDKTIHAGLEAAVSIAHCDRAGFVVNASPVGTGPKFSL